MELKMDRKTVRKIINKVKSGNIEPPFGCFLSKKLR
jgi:hypothetical protein